MSFCDTYPVELYKGCCACLHTCSSTLVGEFGLSLHDGCYLAAIAETGKQVIGDVPST